MVLLCLLILIKNVRIILFIGVRIKRLFNIIRNIIIYLRSRFILITIEAIIMIRYNKINNIHNLFTINQNNQLTESLLSDIEEGFSENESD